MSYSFYETTDCCFFASFERLDFTVAAYSMLPCKSLAKFDLHLPGLCSSKSVDWLIESFLAVEMGLKEVENDYGY